MAATKPWDRPQNRRPSATLDRRRVLIVCEDEKSSRYYFESFPVDYKRAQVLAVGAGMNTDSLVEYAVELRDDASRTGKPFNEVWCVFDRDSFPLANYNRAFQMARANSIKVTWANEAFEIWYLLHFNYHDTGLSRDDYRDKLKPHFIYNKADKDTYAKLKPYQETAVRNSRRLNRHWIEVGEIHPERMNPSTNVHELVEFLNELVDLGAAD
jgi:hypothetical protein